MSPDASSTAAHSALNSTQNPPLNPVLHRFALDYVVPHAAGSTGGGPAGGEIPQRSSGPDSAALLREAFERNRMEVRAVDGSGHTLVFAGVVVGGLQGRVTTLVRAYGRAVSDDAGLTREHLKARKLPLPAEDDAPSATLPVEVFVVAGTPVSAIVRVPPMTVRAAAEPSGQGTTAEQAAAGSGQTGPGPAEEGTSGAGVSAEAGTASGAGGSDQSVDAREDRWSTGLAVDVFDAVSPEVLALAVDAVQAVPGIGAGAARLNLAELDSAAKASIEALVVDADIAAHERPDIGTDRGVSEAIAQQILERASK